MTVFTISPQVTTEVLTDNVNAHPAPDDHLKSYPDNATKGEKSFGILSKSIALDQLDPAATYVVKDVYDRVLCVNGAGAGGWQWAYFGQYASYPKDVMPISFASDPTKNVAALSAHIGSRIWPLYANGTSTTKEWTFWAGDNYKGYPVMMLKAQVSPQNQDAYELIWSNAGNDMSLCADEGPWNWLYVSNSKSSQLTFHKFYVQASRLAQLFKATWPGATFSFQGFGTHTYLEAISDAQARRIYRDSGLQEFNYKPSVFDSDDFSYVYKAQASKDAYLYGTEYGYAVGLLFGTSNGSEQAANVFIDVAGRVRVIEPQTGQIMYGEDWAFTPSLVLM